MPHVTPVSRLASVSRVLEKFQVAPCLVCLGKNDQISPAVVAGVGVDAVDCSTQVRVSTITYRGLVLLRLPNIRE